MTETFDRIEKQIDIDAGAERVWSLISEPGWYINDKTITEHRIERSGDVDIVHDPVHGAFAFRTVTLDPPKYAAFRWIADPDKTDGPSTLVEFWIDETGSNSVVLKVVESGFASLPGDAAERRKKFDDNTEGWTIELGVAKSHLEDAQVDVRS
ncbi:uncharacterized protein YndB with AHSA1/START domain [Williamsia limnetica]|uniref:Uncharacterized protein YndB with AHSA1/START domain n=1 Tax=Williamsia limnetica TaxID=882452 RepID=A0A318R965_WILLI|nr:ATPase [Williamsia limnetica]PYE12165.1 uncharacterized protein YndB with AHSA1/START domain [Williamsia limnetica]